LFAIVNIWMSSVIARVVGRRISAAGGALAVRGRR